MDANPFGPVGTLPQATRRDFSGVGYDEAMRRAREIVPVLARARAGDRGRARAAARERAAAARDRAVSLSPAEGLRRHGARFRRRSSTSRPRSRAAARRRRGTSATSRCHHWILGYYEPETQHEVWDANPDALIASSIALAAGRGRKVDGGFIVSGRWPFSSGVDNSDWNMLAVTVYATTTRRVDWRLCLVPKTDYEIIDTWYAMGMAGTGSKDIAVKELFVPRAPRARAASARAAATSIRAPRSTAGRSSASRSSAAAGHPLSPASIGAAEGAYEHVRRIDGASAWAPTRARRSPISRPCRSRSPARACLIELRPRYLLRAIGRSRCRRCRRAQRNARHGDQAALARAVGLRGEPGARGGRDAVVMLRRAGPLHARSPAAPPARRAWR